MATIESGVQWGSSPKMYFDFSYEKKRDGSTQYYTITVSCRALTGSSYFGYPIYIQIFLDGIEKTSYTLKNASPNQWSAAITSTTDWLAVSNKTSGTTALSIRAYSGMGTTYAEKTFSYSLEIDPAASTIGATDANIGATSVISIDRKNAAYTHSVAYQFGSLNGYLVNASGEISDSEVKLSAVSISFPIPESFYGQIPNSPRDKCTLTIRTYSGSTLIGIETGSFKVTAAEDDCRPMVSGTVEDVNEATIALTGDESVLVKGMSSALCTMTAEARNSATLMSRTIGGIAVEENERTIPNIELNEVIFTATDSRGYSETYKALLTMVEYVSLTCNVSAKRTDPTSGNVSLYIDGKCFNGSFGAEENALEVRCSVGNDEWLDLEPQIGDTSYEVNAILSGLDYQRSHRITVEISDKLMALTKTVTVGKGIPVFDWGENDFSFNVPVWIQGVELDRIVEADTSGIWTYEKWLSGKSVCWGILGTDTESGAGTSTFGDASVAYSSRTTDFPAIFTEAPVVFVCPTDAGMGLVAAENDGSTAGICKVTVHGASEAIGPASVYAVGKWK